MIKYLQGVQIYAICPLLKKVHARGLKKI